MTYPPAPASLGLSTDRPCTCLCGQHRDAGMICDGDATTNLIVTGGLGVAAPVSMCTPCATWWKTNRPDRVMIPRQPGGGW